jgi:hypothetical protein
MPEKKTFPVKDNTWGLMRGLQKPEEDKRAVPTVGKVHQDAVSSRAMEQFRQEASQKEAPLAEGVNILIPDNVSGKEGDGAIHAQLVIKSAEQDNLEKEEKKKSRQKLTLKKAV